jgi:D-serine deaminase-like pyridoxal phosphate-dependent protein
MTTTEKNKYELDTPCLVLDIDILEQNIKKMQTTAKSAGKNLRPHAKTHKCSILAQMQINAGAIGVCAAKLSEAEALIKAGIENILITGPVVTPRKIEKLIDLLKTTPSLMVVVDHPDNIKLLDIQLQNRGLSMGVLLDIDVGLNRTGVKPSDAPQLANHIISCNTLSLMGVQAYAGHLQHVHSYEQRKLSSHQCLHEAINAFHKIQTIAPSCTIFSATGTGTFDIDLAIEEISEMQVGSYVCMDTEYIEIGSAENKTHFQSFPPALRLLTTVISTNQKDFVTVDAGLKSLYQDGGKPQVIVPENSNLEYNWFGDEYGMITSIDNSKLPQGGTVLELITSHCDPTINLFDKYYITKGEKVIDIWPIDLRGCSL